MGDGELKSFAGCWFVAIELPAYVRDSLAGIRARAGEPTGIKWVSSYQFHLTLAFLGEVERGHQESLLERLPAAKVKPFFIGLERVGVFPGKGRPQVLWAGLTPADPVLFQLRAKLERILLDVGLEPELRCYHPHVTIARCGLGGAVPAARIVANNQEFGTDPFLADGFTLFSSRLTDRGSVYERLLQVDWKA